MGDEQGHLGHTEIFCRFDQSNSESAKAVQEWQKKVGERALEGCFVVAVNVIKAYFIKLKDTLDLSQSVNYSKYPWRAR